MKPRFVQLVIGMVLALAVGGLSVGCDALSDATSVDVPIDIKVYPQSVDATIPQTDEDCVDLNSIKDYADNKDMIESGSLQKATFQVIDLQQPSFVPSMAVMETLDFYLEFDPMYNDTRSYHIGAFTNVAFADVMDQQMAIPVEGDAKQAIDKIVSGRQKFCVKAVYGPLTSGPATAAFIKGELILTVKFTASVL